MLNLIQSLFGTSSDREINKMQPLLEAIRAFEPQMVHMSNDQLRAQTAKFKTQLDQGAALDDLLPEAFATVREVSKRVVGLRQFDVQMIGGIVLHRGGIAEMVTGEGKTLVATMPLYLNALTGKGAHLVTVNDYLARRDREWMGPIYEFLGLNCGLIQHHLSTPERQVAYRADITYGTNNEFGFDYLRDNMAHHPDLRVQRQLHYAVIDEIDSILIDEARTPLIISGRPEKSTGLYLKADEAVRKLRRDVHYEVEEKQQNVILTEEGMTTVEELLGVDDLFVNDHMGLAHMVNQSLKAHNFFRRDDEYVVRNNEVLIVDEFTGRVMEGRRFSDGLHQALEAKERVPIQFEMQTIASITYQNFFMLYDKIAGMTGTAMTEGVEFNQIYGLDVVQIPTNLPMQRDDYNDLVFASERGKFKHVVDEIVRLHEQGRPVLVGTTSIEKSEYVAQQLKERGVTNYQVLNAKYHEKEAAIVANAGKRGAITIATNMAGRGTDIKLGEGVRDFGGLAIVGTERHESRRIDNQLRGRCGRQGDPGTTQFFLSLEDEVARLFGGDKVRWLLDKFSAEGQMDEEPLEQRMVSRTIERAQRQVEEQNFEIRKRLKEFDDVMNKQREIIYTMRQEVLEDRDVTEQLTGMFESLIQEAVDTYAGDDVLPDDWDLEGLERRLNQLFGFEPRVIAPEEGEEAPKPLVEDLIDQVIEEYKRREAIYADELRQQFREHVGGDESRIDFQAMARKHFHDWEKMALLRAVDERWIDHLYTMDYLKQSVNLRAYGQRDPLVEYKREGFETFMQMMQSIEEEVVQTLFRVTSPEVRQKRSEMIRQGTLTREEDPFAKIQDYNLVGADKQQDRSFRAYDTGRFALAGQSAAAARQQQAGQAAESEKSQAIAADSSPQSSSSNRRERRRQAAMAKKKNKRGGTKAKRK